MEKTFKTLGKVHINVDQILYFYWENNEVLIQFANKQFPVSFPDKYRGFYKALCRQTSVLPIEFENDEIT